ncbi:RGS domain-containing protein [Gorgonomyces haynaldii]|nr:RGS domain-containing protein [Gorgonomyces haynaldii]
MDVLFEGLWAPTMEDAGSENKYNRRLDIQLVIKNELSSPFTYQEFHSFLKTLHSEENLEFLNQILKYQKLASPFFPVSIHKRERAASRGRSNSSLPPLLPEKEHSPTDSAMDPHSPVSPKGVTPEVFQNSMENVRQAAQKLVNSYLTIGQGAEVNVPSRIRDPLLAHLSKGNLHPELFKDAYDHISTVLRQGPFAQFLANAQNAPIVPHEDDVPRVSLQQIVDRETLAPYAYQDYLEFLKIDHQEESLEFLDTVMKYRRQTLPYFPDAVLFRMKTLNINARPISMIINRKLSVKSVDGESPVEIDKTEFTPSIKPNSVSDEEWVQIKSKISDSFSEMVETFVVPGAVKEVNLPVRVRKTIEECYRQHVTHPHVFTKAYEHIYNMLRENTLQKFLKKTYFESPNAPALLELPKVTMKNLILNELKSPYGNQEFYIFLKGEVMGLMVALCGESRVLVRDCAVSQKGICCVS